MEDLAENFVEVLKRAELCGLTFKPSKVVIAPETTVLFGWKKTKQGWSPTAHTVAPLMKAEPPTTVKQARSWIGSYKQFTECIPKYAALLGPLENTISSRSYAERIVWTEELLNAFEKCKKSLNDIKMIQVPKPSDTLHTFSDFSKGEKAVGGRLKIHRTVNGKLKKLLGGHFSCRISRLQEKWYPCEGEALATRLVLEHYSGYIKESKNQTIHHTDNQPVVQAWKRSKTGAFSASARISTFLSGLSALNIEIVHTPGKELKSSDYNSRNPQECTEEKCQICKFAFKLAEIGERVLKISVNDILQGKANMPFTQRKAWIAVQKNYKVHQDLSSLIDSSQTPTKKKTGGDNTTLKRLHNLFKTGKLKKASDGLITVKNDDEHVYEAISVSTSMFPGLIQAIHLKLDHPSKFQLQKISSRYFYSPGFIRVIDEKTTNCLVCTSLKQLPRELFSESTVETPVFGRNFSADVIRIHNQKILLTREKLSQFTITEIIHDERSETLKPALISAILNFIPATGGIVQLDCATAWQALKTEAENEGSVFKKLNIKLDLGRTLNVNKNPIAENAIREFHKEQLKLDPAGGPISKLDLAMLTRNMNSRIRSRGLSAKEIVFQRDQVTNISKPVDDSDISKEQFEKRKEKHPIITAHSNPNQIKIGDNIFLKNDKSKLRGREMYKVVDIYTFNEEQWAKLQKTENQFRAKRYDVKCSEIFPVPGKIQTSEGMTVTNEDETKEHIDKEVPEQVEENTDEASENTVLNDGTNNHGSTVESTIDNEPGVSPSRGKRKSAEKGRNKIKDLSARGLLNIKIKQRETPKHGWDWIQFQEMLEYNDNMNFFNPLRKQQDKQEPSDEEMNEVEDNDVSEDNNKNADILSEETSPELHWDSSPEQFDATFNIIDKDNILMADQNLEEVLQPVELFPTPQRPSRLLATTTDPNTISLTSSDSDDSEVFPAEPSSKPPRKRTKLKRRNAIRKRGPILADLSYPNSPITRSQLQNVGVSSRPSIITCPRNTCDGTNILPNPDDQYQEEQDPDNLDDVRLESSADVLQDDSPEQIVDDSSPILRRSSRCQDVVDYKALHSKGKKGD